MRIRKAKFPKKALALIGVYRRKELAELKGIKSKWACGKYRHKAIYHYRYAEGYRLFYVELKALIDSADFGEMGHAKLEPSKLFNGVNERDFRVVQVLDHWRNGGFIDPPEICLDRSQKITFGDGRHRTVTAFHIGKKEIPVFVHVTGVKGLSKLIKLRRAKALSKTS